MSQVTRLIELLLLLGPTFSYINTLHALFSLTFQRSIGKKIISKYTDLHLNTLYPVLHPNSLFVITLMDFAEEIAK